MKTLRVDLTIVLLSRFRARTSHPSRQDLMKVLDEIPPPPATVARPIRAVTVDELVILLHVSDQRSLHP